MTVIIRPLCPDDRAEWLRMRQALWTDVSVEELVSELPDWVAGQQCAVFVAEKERNRLCGFLEVAIRPSNVNGAVGRFGYIEGWYVDPDSRRQGVGGSLVRSAELWARSQNCDELHSDARVDNVVSQDSHRALGFVEVERLVHFEKRLQ